MGPIFRMIRMNRDPLWSWDIRAGLLFNRGFKGSVTEKDGPRKAEAVSEDQWFMGSKVMNCIHIRDFFRAMTDDAGFNAVGI